MMSRNPIACALLVVTAAACGSDATSPAETQESADNPAPTVLSVDPPAVVVGHDEVAVTISGQGFISDSETLLDGDPRASTFVSSSELRMTLTATDRLTPAQYQVTVLNGPPGGGESARQDFEVEEISIDRWIAHHKDWSGGRDLHLTNHSTGEEMRLTTGLQTWELPVWSPDGGYLAFIGRPDGQGTPEQLFVVAADGSGLFQLTDLLVDARYPAWSPDGQRIAFDAAHDLYVVARDGAGGPTKIVESPYAGIRPHWAPDGEWIAYQGGDLTDPDPFFGGIYKVRPDGTDLTMITADGWDWDRWVRWSPDGEYIAFGASQDLFIVRPDATDRRQLTFTPTTGDWFPRWSPDGSRLAFHTDGGSHWDIAVMVVASGDIVGNISLQSIGRPALYPSWSADGSRLVFSADIQWFGIAPSTGSWNWEFPPYPTQVGAGSYGSLQPGS